MKNKKDKFSDVYAEGKEFGKLLGIKDSKDVLKLLKSEDDFIFTEEFDKVVSEVKEEDYSKIKEELDKIKPIIINCSDKENENLEDNYFKKWYDEEFIENINKLNKGGE